MDVQNTQNEKNYTKGFNAGYLLNQHEPALLKQILATPQDKDNDYFSGLQDGKKQHDKEKVIAQMKQAQQKGKDKEREK
jgi:hypothetical protein